MLHLDWESLSLRAGVSRSSPTSIGLSRRRPAPPRKPFASLAAAARATPTATRGATSSLTWSRCPRWAAWRMARRCCPARLLNAGGLYRLACGQNPLAARLLLTPQFTLTATRPLSRTRCATATSSCKCCRLVSSPYVMSALPRLASSSWQRRLRMILDTRAVNDLFEEPAHSRLPTPAS